MRWIIRFSVLLLLLLAMTFAASAWFIHHQLKQANLELLSWEMKQFSLQSLQLKTLSFNYHRPLRDTQKVTIKNLTLDWSELKQWWFEDYFQFNQLTVESITILALIQALKESPPTLNNSNTSSPITWPSNTEEWLSNPKRINQFAWLPLIPKQIHIKQFMLTQSCPAGTCSLSGNLNTKMIDHHYSHGANSEQSQTQSLPLIQLSAQLHSADHPENTLSVSSQFYFNPSQASPLVYTENSLPKLKAELALKTLNEPYQPHESDQQNSPLTLRLQSALTAENQLSTQLKLQGLPPEASWFSSLSNWTGFSLSETAKQQLQQQAATPIELEIEHQLALKSLGQLLNQTDNDLEAFKSQLNTQLTANMTLPQAVAIPNIGLVKGALNAKLSVQDGLIETYQLNGSGHLSALQQSALLKPIHRAGLKLDSVDFQINSQSQSDPSGRLPQPTLATNLSRFTTQNLPIKITLKSASPKNVTTETTQFKLTANGTIEYVDEFNDKLNNKLKIIIEKGHLSLTQANVNLDSLFAKQDSIDEKNPPKKSAKANQYKLSHLKADLPFQAEYSNRELKISSTHSTLQGNFIDHKNALKLAQSQLDLKPIKLQLTHNLNEPVKWSLTSQEALLTSQVTSPGFQVKDLSTQLKNLSLKNTLTPNKAKEQIEISALYNLGAKQIKQAFLHPQSWTAKGRLSGNLNHLSISGRIENKSKLNIQHTSQYQSKKFQSEWQIQPLFLLAGNPLKKTTVKWPEQLVLANGQLALNGQISLNTTLLAKNPMAALSGKMQLSLKQISGLYQNTTLNQISSEIELSLKNKQLKLTTPNLEIVQINHGVIAGPINLSAEYQTSIEQPLSGRLTLNHFQTELFNGQAWLNQQTIDLSKPFKTQLFLKDIDVAELLKQYPNNDFSGTGRFEGKLPFQIDLTGQRVLVNLEDGQLTSQHSGGLLQYKPAGKVGMSQTHQSMKAVLDVLEDFHYSLLKSSVSISPDQKLHLNLTLQGNNPVFESGRAINLNVQLEEDLPALITSMQITNQVSETIKKRIREKLEKPL